MNEQRYLLVKEIPNWGGGAMSHKSPMMKSGIPLRIINN